MRPELKALATATALLSFLLPLPAASQLAEIQIAPGADSVPLPFDGWLGETGDLYQILQAPTFGTLVDEVYSPAPEFWLAGADTFRVRVERADPNEVFERLVLLTPARLIEESYTNTFEAREQPPPVIPNPPAGTWQVRGDASTLSFEPGLAGSATALGIQISSTGTASIFAAKDPNSDGENSVGALGDVDLTPPVLDPGGVVSFGGTGHGAAGFGSGQIRLRAAHDGDDLWRLQARVLDCDPQAPQCETPWIPILPGETSFDVWAGPKSFGHPVAAPTSLRFTVSQGLASTTSWLEAVGVDTSREFDFGVIESEGLDDGQVVLDNTTYRAGNTPWEERGYLAEDFENLTIGSEWQLAGPLGTTSINAVSGGGSLRIDLEDAALAGHAYLLDTTPSGSTSLAASFMLDVVGLDLPQRTSAKVFSAGGSDDPEVQRHVSLILLRSAQGYEVRARARDDHGLLHKTPWALLPSPTVRLTVAWAAGDGDGYLRLFVDGAYAGEVAALETASKRVESLRFGVYGISLGSPLGGGDYPMRMDDVISAR